MKKMSRTLMILVMISFIFPFCGRGQSTTQIFLDEFTGTQVSDQLWHFPTWVSQTDGTYLGRTQLRCRQNETLPSTANGLVYINAESYNPTGFSFYGTDLISNKAFKPGNGLIFTVRAKINSPIPGGVVGGIYLYDLTIPGARGWHDIASSSDGVKLAAIVYGGNVWTSTDSGVTWTEQNMTGPHNWNRITSSSDGTKLAAVESDGYIWTSVNSGLSWTKQISAGKNVWISIASSSDGTKLVTAALRGVIWTSTNSGLTWTKHEEVGYRNWYDVTSSTNGQKLAAIVYGENIWTSNDFGNTWKEQKGAGINYWEAITSSANGEKLAATSFLGGIWTSSDYGATWANPSIDAYPQWGPITSSADGTKLAAVHHSGNVWTSRDSGATWKTEQSVYINWQSSIVSSSDGKKLAAVVYGGNIWTSPDENITWVNQSGNIQSSHDEIDFELLTNSVNKVHTNVYQDEPMGVGHPDSTIVATPITEYHTYKIKWLPSSVSWLIDDKVIRTSTTSPKGPMRFNLNM